MAFRFDTVRVWRAGGRYDHFVLRYALPIEAFRSAASSLDDGAAACGHAHPIDPVRETESGLATLVAARNDILTSACVHYVDRSLEVSEKARLGKQRSCVRREVDVPESLAGKCRGTSLSNQERIVGTDNELIGADPILQIP